MVKYGSSLSPALMVWRYLLNTSLEKDSVTEMELLEQSMQEYQAETIRCRGLLARVGPAQAYCETMSSICSYLNLDTSNMVGIETAVAELQVKQAESGPGVGKVKGEVDRIRNDMVQLYERLARLEGVVSMAAREEREESSVAGEKNKKYEYLVAKLADYRRVVERGEGVLARNGANDESTRHDKIVKLQKKLSDLESECEPLIREQQGFLALPPSKELARVELARSTQEMELLEKQVAGQISSLHPACLSQ